MKIHRFETYPDSRLTEGNETRNVEVSYTHNTDCYTLSVDPRTGAATFSVPAQHREFSIDDIYLENPDISLLLDGRLIDKFREQLKRYGVELPKPPYYPAIKLSRGKTSAPSNS